MLALAVALSSLSPWFASAGCMEPSESVSVTRGTAPVVVVIAHAGTKTPVSCGSREKLPRRVCAPEHDLLCKSGPCRVGNDLMLREVGLAFAAHLGACLGAPPTVIVNEVRRSHYDASRDADDGFASSCALGSDDARPYWDAFVRAVDAAAAAAVAAAGSREGALLVDVHTYGGNPVAPAPALIIGTGRPFGSTMPSFVAREGVARLMGAAAPPGAGAGAAVSVVSWMSLRDDLAVSFARSFDGVRVFPEIMSDAEEETMMSGRNILARASKIVDAMQLEISAQVRDEPELAAYLAAQAVCGTFAPQVSRAPAKSERGSR